MSNAASEHLIEQEVTAGLKTAIQHVRCDEQKQERRPKNIAWTRRLRRPTTAVANPTRKNQNCK
jgi:hypothetical protein